jgi:hypothetical protein
MVRSVMVTDAAPDTLCGSWPGMVVGDVCQSFSMRVRTDDGVELNAEFGMEADGRALNLVLESVSGKGSPRSRYHEYAPALRLLLARRGRRRAILMSAVVDSARITGQMESQRWSVSWRRGTARSCKSTSCRGVQRRYRERP